MYYVNIKIGHKKGKPEYIFLRRNLSLYFRDQSDIDWFKRIPIQEKNTSKR